jgi:hypothetical protein
MNRGFLSSGGAAFCDWISYEPAAGRFARRLGLSNDQSAERLFLSPLPVKTHLNRAMMKLAARDRAQLVVLAYQTSPRPPRRQHRLTPVLRPDGDYNPR